MLGAEALDEVPARFWKGVGGEQNRQVAGGDC